MDSKAKIVLVAVVFVVSGWVFFLKYRTPYSESCCPEFSDRILANSTLEGSYKRRL